MSKYLCVVGLLIGVFFDAYTQGVSYTPKYSNEFMNIGVGARALGMGGAHVALVDDVTATYWNPAGLMEIKSKYEGSLMRAEYFAGIAKYDYAAFAAPIDRSSHIGVSVIRFAVDDIPDTRFLYDANGAINYNNVTFFSAADYGFVLSYARNVGFVEGDEVANGLRFGSNIKVIHRNVGKFAKAWGFGIDVGAMYYLNKYQFGLMLRDISGTYNSWSLETDLVEDIFSQTGNQIPQNATEITLPRAILGVARKFAFNEQFSLLATVDLDFTFDGQRNVLVGSQFGSLDPRAGMELGFKDFSFYQIRSW